MGTAELIAAEDGLAVRIVRAQRFLKMRPGYAEVVLRRRRRQVGPEQAQQKFTAVGVIRLDQKIGQQANRLTVGEGDCAQLVMLNL